MATLKQKEAFKEITENHMPISTAMRKVGYTDITSERPQNLTESKGWKELIDQYLPDDTLAKVHEEGLKAVNEEGLADHAIRHKFLDTAYKVKGSYAPEKKLTVNVDVNTSEQELLLAQQLLEQGRIKTISNQSEGINPDVMDRPTQD